MRRPAAPATTTAPPTATPTPSAVWEMASVAANAAGVAARDAAAKAPAGSAGEGLAAFSAATERLAAALGATTARATQEVRVDILRDDRSGMFGLVCRIPRGAVGRRGRGWQSDYIGIGRSFFPPTARSRASRRRGVRGRIAHSTRRPGRLKPCPGSWDPDGTLTCLSLRGFARLGVGPGRIGGYLCYVADLRKSSNRSSKTRSAVDDEIFHCGSVGIGFFF